MEFSQSALMRQLARTLPAVALGAIAGYGYYYFIGCTSGACPITSNPWISTVYGAAIGGLLMPWKTRRRQSPENQGNGKEATK